MADRKMADRKMASLIFLSAIFLSAGRNGDQSRSMQFAGIDSVTNHQTPTTFFKTIS